MASKWQILMLDQDSHYAASLTPFLQARLGQIHYAAAEVEAEEILKTRQIDLLLMDVMLSEPDSGLRFCRRIIARDKFADLPVLFLSSADERFGLNIRSRLTEPGYCPAHGFLDKSAQPSQIADHLERFLKAQR